MPINKSLRDILIEKEDEIYFLGSVILFLALTPSLVEILTRPWLTNNILFQGIASVISFVDYSGISKIINLIVGFYLASLLFLVVDEKKRFQTFVLIIILIVFVFNVFTGKLFPNVQWSLTWIIAGFVVGLFASIDDIKKEKNPIRILLKNKKEFQKPAANLTFVSLSIIVVSFVAYYTVLFLNKGITPNNDFLKDLAIVIIFFIFFTKFMKYEIKNSSILVLGPKESGKSLFLAGAYLNALEVGGNVKISPSEKLIDLVDEMQKKGWVRRTSKFEEYSFNYRHGTLFPKDIQFDTCDYPGPYLTGLYEFMKSHELPKGNSEDIDANLVNIFFSDEPTSKKIFETLESRVKGCDKLIFLIDGSKYPKFTDMGIKDYLKILKFLNENHIHKDYYIVVTKCDLFFDAYADKEKLDKVIIRNESYNDFKNFINDLFLENTSMKPLLMDTNCEFVFPVLYYTVLEDGNHIPVRDRHSNIMPPFGYDPLLNYLVK
jgi:hypothetical protein